jgi:hypothetical protein
VTATVVGPGSDVTITNALITVPYDTMEIDNNGPGDAVSAVRYLKDGDVVATLTMTYGGTQLIKVERS